MGDKIYTQEDVDNITDKVRAKLSREVEQLKELNSTLAKSNEELLAYKNDNEDYRSKFADVSLKSEFLKRGGVEAAWDDFKALNGGLANLSNEELDKEFEVLKTNKPFYFNASGVEGSVKLDDNGELKDLFGNADNSLIDGTIYRANKF